MTDQPTTTTSALDEAQLEKLYMENTLLRVAGVLFCHDAKRAKSKTEKIEIQKQRKEEYISIAPHPHHGQPGPLAHKIFVALIKKHSDYGRPVPHEVSFGKRELMRMLGRNEWGGSYSKQLSDAIEQIRNTSVTAFFKGTNDRFFEERFTLFPRVLIERRNSHTDPIEACTVSLAPAIIASLRDQHFTCLNHFLMQRLGTIGQALYMRLFFHLAHLYDGHHKKRLEFKKTYADICAEWLGGLTVRDRISHIERDQLGPHLRQLVQAKFLASYSIHKAEMRDGFVIRFRPGEGFFADYDRFYRHREQGELQFNFHADRQTHIEPMQLAYLFVQKRTGQIPASVSTKDRKTAQNILEQVPFAEAEQFINFALEGAQKTKFDMQTLGGLVQYIPGYLASRKALKTHQRTLDERKEREREEAERRTYDRARHDSAQALFATLPKSEQDTVDSLARAHCAGSFGRKDGPLARTLFEMARVRFITERHPDKVPSFEQWQAGARNSNAARSPLRHEPSPSVS